MRAGKVTNSGTFGRGHQPCSGGLHGVLPGLVMTIADMAGRSASFTILLRGVEGAESGRSNRVAWFVGRLSSDEKEVLSIKLAKIARQGNLGRQLLWVEMGWSRRECVAGQEPLAVPPTRV